VYHNTSSLLAAAVQDGFKGYGGLFITLWSGLFERSFPLRENIK
jgi:hypothetical protein